MQFDYIYSTNQLLKRDFTGVGAIVRTVLLFYRFSLLLLPVCSTLIVGALLLGRALPHSVLAFVSERTGRAQVYMLEVDRLYTLMISRNDYVSDAPTWSSSGDLAYVRSRPEGRDVMIYNPFTGLTCEISYLMLDETAPAWSPSGRLAYVSGRGTTYDVFVQEGCAANTAHIVTRESYHAVRSPQWSSAGRLVYTDEPLFGGMVTVILNPDTGVSNVIRQSTGFDSSPLWYGDHLLAFVAIELSDLDSRNFEIIVYDDRTGEFRSVSNHPAIDSQPAWSSDGRLAFMSNRDGNNEIYVYDFATDTLTNVSQSPRDDQMPAWSSDGRLAYMSAVGSAFDIMVMDRVPGGSPRVVVNHPSQDYNPVWMP